MPEVERAIIVRDRPIFHSRSRIAYFGALFAHAWDEWLSYVQQDQRVIAVGIATVGLGIWFAGLWSGWSVTLKDILPGVLIAALPTSVLAVGVYLWCWAKAPYRLQMRLRDEAAAQLASAVAAHEQAIRESEAERDGITAAWESDKAKWLAERKRPRVTLELSKAVVGATAGNDGEPALNMSAICTLSPTRAIQFGPVSRIGSEPTAVTIGLVQNGNPYRPNPSAPLTYDDINAFVQSARREAIAEAMEETQARHEAGDSPVVATREQYDATYNALLIYYGMQPSGEFVRAFEVIYTDFDRHLHYHTPHLLRHSSHDRYLRVEVAEVPEPAPTVI